MTVYAIEIRRARDGKFFAPSQWPLVSIFAADLLDNPAYGDGATALATRDRDKNEILVSVENGEATYRIRSLLTDGNYLCDLVGSDWLEPPR